MWLRVGFLALAAAVTGLAVFLIVTVPAIIPGSALPAYSPDVGNGQMVFNAGGCSACHAAAGQDRTMLGGGLAIPSPFGTFYAPNISPDANDGIGGWSEADFVTALKRGTSPAGTHYFPAFPYGSYQRVGIEDIRDLFAYIKTLPPVPGRIRDHDLSFPFNVRRLVGGWKFLFLDRQPLSPDAARSAEWNRSAYLVNGLGHCAECHSPAIFSAALWPRNDLPVDRTRKARDGYRTSRKRACAPGRKRTSPLSLRQVNYQMAILPEVRWFASSRIFRNWATTIAQQWRSISSRCLPSMARHLRKSDRCTVIADCRRAGIRRLACRSSHAGPGQSRNRSSCGEDQ